MNNLPVYQSAINDRTQEETTLDSFRGLGCRGDVFDLYSFPASACPWHWHNEAEAFYMRQGSVIYRTTEGAFRFDQGDVGFVNPDVLHMTEAAGPGPAIQQYFIFFPRMIACPLNNTFEEKYIDPLSRDCGINVVRFPAETRIAAAMRELMDRAYTAYSDKNTGYEIYLRNALSELWLLFFINRPQGSSAATDNDSQRVRAMIRFIENNYAQKITLDDITGAAHIGKGEGARCFRRTLHMTIFDYLIAYRIDRAKEMLSASAKSVTRISQDCGFPSMNYFGKVFRGKTGKTPTEYRKNDRLQEDK